MHCIQGALSVIPETLRLGGVAQWRKRRHLHMLKGHLLHMCQGCSARLEKLYVSGLELKSHCWLYCLWFLEYFMSRQKQQPQPQPRRFSVLLVTPSKSECQAVLLLACKSLASAAQPASLDCRPASRVSLGLQFGSLGAAAGAAESVPSPRAPNYSIRCLGFSNSSKPERQRGKIAGVVAADGLGPGFLQVSIRTRCSQEEPVDRASGYANVVPVTSSSI